MIDQFERFKERQRSILARRNDIKKNALENRRLFEELKRVAFNSSEDSELTHYKLSKIKANLDQSDEEIFKLDLEIAQMSEELSVYGL
jgi:uncharacterized protein YigA (DUF484 family)